MGIREPHTLLVAACIAVAVMAIVVLRSEPSELLTGPCEKAVWATAGQHGDPVDRFFESEDAYREAWENADDAALSAFKNAGSAEDAEYDAMRARLDAWDEMPLDYAARFAASRDALATIAEFNRVCLGESPYGTYEESGVTALAQSVYDSMLPSCEVLLSIADIGPPWELQQSSGLYTPAETVEDWPPDKRSEWLRNRDRDRELCAPLDPAHSRILSDG